jgi:hypothetical protein
MPDGSIQPEGHILKETRIELPKQRIGPGVMNPRIKYFPIMGGDQIRGIEWELVEPHEQQAKRNHQQSLNMLASRGGLDPLELWCVVNDMRWRELISIGTPHKELREISIDCEAKLVERFGNRIRMK